MPRFVYINDQAFTYEWLGALAESAAGLTATWAGVSFGADVTGRMLVLVSRVRSGGAALNLTALSIGGVTPTQDAGATGAATNGLYIHQALGVSGTSGTVSITADQSMRAVAGLWRLIPAFTTAQVAASNGYATTTGTSLTLADAPTKKDGILLGGISHSAAGAEAMTLGYNGADSLNNRYEASLATGRVIFFDALTTETAAVNDITNSGASSIVRRSVAANYR